jgi:hypothetical protein
MSLSVYLFKTTILMFHSFCLIVYGNILGFDLQSRYVHHTVTHKGNVYFSEGWIFQSQDRRREDEVVG